MPPQKKRSRKSGSSSSKRPKKQKAIKVFENETLEWQTRLKKAKLSGEEKANFSVTVGKMTYHTLCQLPDLRIETEKCIKPFSYVCFLASVFLNFYVVHTLDAGKKVANEIKEKPFFYSVAKVINGTNEQVLPQRKHWNEAYQVWSSLDLMGGDNEGTFRLDDSDINQIWQYAAGEHITVCMNHVALNIYPRVKKHCEVFLGDYLSNKDDIRKMSHFYMRVMCGEELNDLDITVLWGSLKVRATPENRAVFKTYVQTNLTKYGNLSLQKYLVKANWPMYLPWLHDIQVYLESKGRSKRFSILPIYSYSMRHMTIDTEILKGLLKRLGKSSEHLLAEDQNDADLWRACYRFQLAETKKRKFYFTTIKTDAYAVSVTLMEEKTPLPPINPDEPPPPLLHAGKNLDDKVIIGHDPGVTSIGTTALIDENGNVVTRAMSGREYNTIQGTKPAIEYIRRLQHEAGIKEALLALPTAKCANLSDLKLFLIELKKIVKGVFEFNAKRKIRSHRFTRYGRRQSSLKYYCERIVGDEKFRKKYQVVLAHGDASFNGSMRGHVPVPTVKAKRALKRMSDPRRGHGPSLKGGTIEFYEVNEDYTSQLCNLCNEKLVPVYNQGRHKSIWGVKRCTKANCSITWGRDVNAALNILKVFVHECLYGERPVKFTHKYQKN